MFFLRLVIYILIISLPLTTFARYERIDRGNLGDDMVEEFSIPVLFGVEFDDLVPDFGDSRGGGTRTHEGQDMRALKGAPIVSPTEAVVIKTGTGSSAGKYVYTANPGGETFRYMHLDYIADLSPGDRLDVGDFIGTVGDTGNAPDGIYHLHFEVRDENNKPTDPYERFDPTGFTTKQKMLFLKDIFSDISDDEEYAEFLVENFTDEFMMALDKKYKLPNALEEVLDDSGVVNQVEALAELTKLITTLPQAISVQLESGDQGPLVALLQLYLIYTGEGAARDRLLQVGPTGYFGSLTEEALIEYQAEYLKINNKGVFDAKTKQAMLKRKLDKLYLN